jgi:preprotein translocase subunit SecY
MKPLLSLSIRLNSASEIPAFFASSLDICLSPLKSIFLKLYFLTTIGFAACAAGGAACESPS